MAKSSRSEAQKSWEDKPPSEGGNVTTSAARPRRIFLGWDRPALELAANWLLDQTSEGGLPGGDHLAPASASQNRPQFPRRPKLIDLSASLVVVPAARARRRLLQLLAQCAKSRGGSLLPPKVVTIGAFPEELYDNAQPLADPATRLLTWLEAFQGLSLSERQLFLPRLTANDLRRELSFAQQLAELHVRLGMEVRSFRSVHEHLERNPESGDRQRWEVLAKVQASYYERLSRRGVWDLQAARNVAIRKQLCRAEHPVVLIGAVDLSESNRQMLKQLGERVTALVFAPSEMEQAFDSVGGFRAEPWLSQRLALPENWIRIVDRPADQATAVLETLRELKGVYSSDEITIGVPDDRVLPALELACENEGLAVRRLEGSRFIESNAARLAIAIAEYLDRSDFSLFAQLVRHPALYRWLSLRLKRVDWLSAVDQFQSKYLASQLSWREPLGVPDGDRIAGSVVAVQTELRALLAPFDRAALSLADLAGYWRQLLARIYGVDSHSEAMAASVLDTESDTEPSFLQLDQMLADVQTHAQWSGDSSAINSVADKPELSASEVLALAFAVGPRLAAGDPPCPAAIELVGWLDLPLDDAPVLIVTAMNEESINSQEPLLPLLPQPLLDSLGIGHPQHRQARNVYALALAVHSRKLVRLICGRRDSEGNPLLISRLLLAEDDEALVHRVNAFFTFAGESVRRRWLRPKSGWAAGQTLRIPQPANVPELDGLSVTRFRDYLKCPYRFYLNAVLHLEPVRDSLREMDGGAFGDLAHVVLERFGRNKIRNSDNAAAIAEFLCDELEQAAAGFRQQSWFAAVEVQLQSLRERLRAFAEIQAAHRAAGWEIIAVEQAAHFDWPWAKAPFEISGRIDRVDRHQDGRLAVWDYKTSDKGTKVNPAHRNSAGDWVDLQLPLYRYLMESVEAVGVDEARQQRDSIQLGYILLPRTIKDVAFDLANWDAEELKTADELTGEVIEKIQSQLFWPPNPEPPLYSEQYAAICQDFIFDRSEIHG